MARHPAPPPQAVAVELEVPFHDVDLLGVAWHGHYPKYLELARTALLRACRLDADDLRALGFRLVVVELHVRHLAPLGYGDRAKVSAWLTEVESRLRIDYQVLHLARGRLVALGSTVLVTTLPSGELCLETPAPILERLRAPGPPSALR